MAKRSTNIALDKGLPVNLDAERMVLGSILLNNAALAEVALLVKPEHFSLDTHRIIYVAMGDLCERGVPIDRVTVAEELQRHGRLESCGGVSYLISLDEGLPQLPNVDSYARIVREKANLRRIIFASQKIIDDAMNGGDAALLYRSAQERLAEIAEQVDGDDGALATPGESISAHPGGLQGFLSPPRGGHKTGFYGLDDLIAGLEPGKLYVIGADVSHGKTTTLTNIALNLAERKVPVLIYSLEMDRSQLLVRAICSRASVATKRVKLNALTSDERLRVAAAASRLADLPFYVDDRSNLCPKEFRIRTDRSIRRKGVQVVGIDYLQIMSYEGFRSEVEALTYTTRALKLYAKEAHIPVLLLSQLSRERRKRPAKEAKPRLGDLRGCGTIANDSDVVIFVYREELDYPDRPEIRGQAEWIVGKQRDGELGTVRMNFVGKYVRFEEPQEVLP